MSHAQASGLPRPPKGQSFVSRHPLSIAIDRFKMHCGELFCGAVSGDYLANRLEAAFTEGWLAAERHMVNALNDPVEVERSSRLVDAVARKAE